MMHDSYIIEHVCCRSDLQNAFLDSGVLKSITVKILIYKVDCCIFVI